MHLSDNHSQDYEASFTKRAQLAEALSKAEIEYYKNKKNASVVCMDVDKNPNEVDGSSLNNRNKRKETRRFRGKQSIFKCPEGPAPHSIVRSVPDYHRNPHKWIKYSLDDVSNEDMTDHSNTQTALSFLKELKARRSQEKMEFNECTSDTKMMFKLRKETSPKVEYRRSNSNSEKSDGASIAYNNDKPMFRNSKVILPEYVVGQKQKKKPKVNRSFVQNNSTTCVKLNHLEELDENEN